jgi:hypothetical protein
MSRFLVYDSTGTIIRVGACVDGMEDIQASNNGEVVISNPPEGVNAENSYILNGVITPYTADELQAKNSMPLGCIWSMPSRTVVDTVSIDTLREQANSLIDKKRDAVIAAFNSFTYAGVVYDGDITAQQNITNAYNFVITGGALPANFQWRAQDNSMHAMTAVDVQGLYAAMNTAIGNLRFTTYAISWQLKAAVSIATTRTGIDVAATWPI